MRIVVKKSLNLKKKTNKQTCKETKTREREREGETEKGTDRNKGDTADFFPFFVKRDWGYFFFLLKRD